MSTDTIVPDTLIDPATMRTGRHRRLLDTLMAWTSDKRIIAALMKSGVMDIGALLKTVEYVNLTAKTKGMTGLSERQMAAQLLTFFLSTREVRRAIAGYVERTYKVPKRQAMRDLEDMRKDLMLQFGGEE